MVTLLSLAVPVQNPTPTKPTDLQRILMNGGASGSQPRKGGGVRGQSKLPPKKLMETVVHEKSHENAEESEKGEAEWNAEASLDPNEEDQDTTGDSEEEKVSSTLIDATKARFKQADEMLHKSIEGAFGREKDVKQSERIGDGTNADGSDAKTITKDADEVHVANVMSEKLDGPRSDSIDNGEKKQPGGPDEESSSGDIEDEKPEKDELQEHQSPVVQGVAADEQLQRIELQENFVKSSEEPPPSKDTAIVGQRKSVETKDGAPLVHEEAALSQDAAIAIDARREKDRVQPRLDAADAEPSASNRR
jgi:hypothetical protein